MKEQFFLGLANALPRLKAMDQLRLRFLKLAGISLPGQCTIWPPLIVRPVGACQNIEIGPGSFINSEVRFGAPAEKIRIGRNVLVGPRVCFETVNHGLTYAPGKGRGMSCKGITVEDEAWIGVGAILTPGVTIGRGAVVAAGAVVTTDVAPMTVVGGVPARLIRSLNETQPCSPGAVHQMNSPPCRRHDRDAIS
jgi:maltose O-acetyltransferase